MKNSRQNKEELEKINAIFYFNKKIEEIRNMFYKILMENKENEK